MDLLKNSKYLVIKLYNMPQPGEKEGTVAN